MLRSTAHISLCFFLANRVASFRSVYWLCSLLRMSPRFRAFILLTVTTGEFIRSGGFRRFSLKYRTSKLELPLQKLMPWCQLSGTAETALIWLKECHGFGIWRIAAAVYGARGRSGMILDTSVGADVTERLHEPITDFHKIASIRPPKSLLTSADTVRCLVIFATGRCLVGN
jgi:hypothetical protein